ncbi:hypothetical protein BKA70DRAFT_1119723 [Coprinopsis sp. MPI-PUGE-AT-0042]|nr:hypothetical protein BKA70DRAFT_1119723 [Coprinopsis sp. MPI-PUGE-AT-0042]
MSLLARTIYDIEQVLKINPTLCRLTGKAKKGLYTDLALVGLSLRTGCLVDSFAPKSPVAEFSQILERLRQDPSTSGTAGRVVHVYEPGAQQSFFLNVDRIPHRIQPLCTESPCSRDITFIKLFPPSDFQVMQEAPPGLVETLREICKLSNVTGYDLPLSFSLPEFLHFSAAVPLAAVIIDYDIAYVPTLDNNKSSSFPIFLSGIPVSTYECILHWDSEGKDGVPTSRITVMKFSCPKPLEETDPHRFSIDVISKRLVNRLRSRLEEADFAAAIEVLHETAVHERLAL